MVYDETRQTPAWRKAAKRLTVAMSKASAANIAAMEGKWVHPSWSAKYSEMDREAQRHYQRFTRLQAAFFALMDTMTA